jgi:hypothetical protein
MPRKAPSRIERVSEVIKALDVPHGEMTDGFLWRALDVPHGEMTDGFLWRALAEAGCLDGVEVHSEAEARRYLRGLLRQHNRRCWRTGDIAHVIFNITRKNGQVTRVTEA